MPLLAVNLLLLALISWHFSSRGSDDKILHNVGSGRAVVITSENDHRRSSGPAAKKINSRPAICP